MEEKESRCIQDNVLFLGNRNDVDRLYQAMDVFVLPSRYEGLPVVGVEAQAAGLPCVLSDKMTEETKYQDNVMFLKIEDNTPTWAKAICRKVVNSRIITDETNQYNISLQAANLMFFYEGIIKSIFE